LLATARYPFPIAGTPLVAGVGVTDFPARLLPQPTSQTLAKKPTRARLIVLRNELFNPDP
jgi:hypothetical protein